MKTAAYPSPERTDSDNEEQHQKSKSSARPAFRVSWPLAGDGRRAVVGESPPSSTYGGVKISHPIPASRIIHVLQGDMEVHYQSAHRVAKGKYAPPTLDLPLHWNSAKINLEDHELLEHFQHAASRSLTIIGHDPVELGNALIRIALSGTTASAKAVLQSLLAFSWIHRHDVHPGACEHKIAAIRSLRVASTSSNVGAIEAIQHVAAGMLLCSFEAYSNTDQQIQIHQSSCTSGEWITYLCGVLNIIQAAGLNKGPQDSDLVILLDWVYYNDVLARFSLQHWKRDTTTSQAPPAAFTLIRLLSAVCEAVHLSTDMSPEHANDHKDYLRVLDWRIRSLDLAAMAGGNADARMAMELYQLAVLVYLNRMSEFQPANQRVRTQQHTDRAFTLLGLLGSCERQFPVFIFGCEARCDEQRAVVLDLIARTEKSVASRSFEHVRLLLQAIWAQDDLAERGFDYEYADRLSRVISRARIMPMFV
ncbi:hypothetical protein N656DRAFT_714134 [Canariomyces notabilis]|uniref:Uncharacterized protein n=1 Tax=Canariomyces notabilis TaxID=2074819 RepID=A0AAN6QHC7_9PEZI|nr:hypothetical protein N656DRAFT_714134 [Canariomyces arenarius]